MGLNGFVHRPVVVPAAGKAKGLACRSTGRPK